MSVSGFGNVMMFVFSGLKLRTPLMSSLRERQRRPQACQHVQPLKARAKPAQGRALVDRRHGSASGRLGARAQAEAGASACEAPTGACALPPACRLAHSSVFHTRGRSTVNTFA